MSKKKIFARLSTSDIILSKKDAKNLPSHLIVVDKEGEFLCDTEIYLIGHELEDGTECDENGNKL